MGKRLVYKKRSFKIKAPFVALPLRKYSNYRMMGIEGFEHPINEKDAQSKIQGQLEIAKELGFLEPKPNVLNIIASHEFSFNGVKNLFGNLQFSAGIPIPLKFYQAAVLASQETLKKLPPGILFLPGTAAINTGEKTAEGKVIYENRGCGITSGLQSEIFEFSKESISSLDGWEEGSALHTGSSPLVIEVKDRLGDGRSIWLACTICLDYLKDIEHFKEPPDIVFVPACGWPYKVPSIDSDIMVMDAIHNPFRNEPQFHFSGVHRVRELKFKPPALNQLIFSIATGIIPAPSFITNLAKSMKNWSYFKETTEPQRYLYKENAILKMKGSTGTLITGEIPLPLPLEKKIIKANIGELE